MSSGRVAGGDRASASTGEAPAVPAARAQRARLFVALDLPADTQRALAAWREPVMAGRDALRGVRAEMLHVTLCFLGSHPIGEIDAIAAACTDGDHRPSGFALHVTGAVWLPRRRPHVLAVTLADESERLGAFQAALAARLRAGGWYPPDDRRFLAHVTVARVRSRTRLHAFELPAPPGLAVTATSFTLYRSHAESGGAHYEALARFGLHS